MQNRTHNCNELRMAHVGQTVQISGWMENVREVSANLAFVVVRDFYGTTQVVIENEEQMKVIKGLNVSFVGRNLAMLYCKAPFDPEVASGAGNYATGIDYFSMPSTRNLGFSVKVTF